MTLPLWLQVAASGPTTRDAGHHTHGESHPWKIRIPDHPARTESTDFRAAKKLAKRILATIGVDKRFLGSDAIQMHHGGSLWLLDHDGWFLVQNEAGIEWSAQFCTDPAKADALRLNARRLYAAFPKTVPEMIRLGYKDAQKILDTRIANAGQVATWVDSIFNACIPLPAVRHVGVLPRGGGRHHYPAPITDIDLVKHDDFQLWVTDPTSGKTVAVVPTSARGSGVSRVRVVYATPGTDLATRQARAEARGRSLELGPRQPLTRQAFAHQAPAGTGNGATSRHHRRTVP
ncbi:MAG: DUF6424 family protein [Actinomycetota bacterium]